MDWQSWIWENPLTWVQGVAVRQLGTVGVVSHQLYGAPRVLVPTSVEILCQEGHLT